MKKYFLMFVTAIVICSLFYGFSIKSSFNPKEGVDTSYTIAVNNSGSYLYNGDVVVWDKATCSTGTFVTTTTTVGAGNVAGVWVVSAGTRTANGDIGRVQVYGYNSAIRVKSTSIAVYDLLIATSTARYGSDIDPTNTAIQQGVFGISFEANTSGSVSTVKGFIKALGN